MSGVLSEPPVLPHSHHSHQNLRLSPLAAHSSSPNTSQSQATSTSTKRVRLEVNGAHAFPGSSEASLLSDISSEAGQGSQSLSQEQERDSQSKSKSRPKAAPRPLSRQLSHTHSLGHASFQSHANGNPVSHPHIRPLSRASHASATDDSDTDRPIARTGRKPLPEAERERRKRERNRQAAAAARRSTANKIQEAEERNAALEREVEALRSHLSSLQRYVYDLEALLRSQDVGLPPRSPKCSATRPLGPCDSLATETTEVTSQSRSPSPEPAPASAPKSSRAIAPSPTSLQLRSLAARTPTPAAAGSTPLESLPLETPVPPLPNPMLIPPVPSMYGSYPFTGPVTPVSHVRDTEAYPSASGFSLPLATPPVALPTPPAPPTASALEALQLELRLQETLQYMQQYGISWSVPDPEPPAFSGGDQYDTMSLSALFNLDALEDDPNDENFEPTSPKPDSSDDESENEGEVGGGSDTETEGETSITPPRKRIRTEAPQPVEEEEEDLFLPIEDVPVPPPAPTARPDMYAEVMASLGLRSREELSEVVTKLFTTVNSRDQVTPQQLEALKQIMRIFQSRAGGDGGSATASANNEQSSQPGPGPSTQSTRNDRKRPRAH